MVVMEEIVPEDLSLEQLEQMMASANMKEFCIAGKALILKKSKEAYEILKKYVFSTDKYKRRYVLSIIFEYPYAIELTKEIDKALVNENEKGFMAQTLLKTLIMYDLKADDEVVIRVLRNNIKDDSWYYQVIKNFEKNQKNMELLLALYRSRRNCSSVRIAMAEQLLDFVDNENYMRLFQMFERDEQPHVRMVACHIAVKMDKRDLLMLFENDKDGHIRKYVARNLAKGEV